MADRTSITDRTPNPNPTTNRRQLLTGTSAFALGGAALLPGSAVSFAAGALRSGAVPVGPGRDPAWPLYLRATEAERLVNTFSGDEEAGVYEALFDDYLVAERKLGATPATSLLGLQGKMMRLAADQYWEPDDGFLASCFGLSILADFAAMTGVSSKGPRGRGYRP